MSCTGIQVQPGCCNCLPAFDGPSSILHNQYAAACLNGNYLTAIYDATTVTPTQLADAKMLFCGSTGNYTGFGGWYFQYSAPVQSMFKDWLLAGGRMWLDGPIYDFDATGMTIVNNFLGYLGSGMQFDYIGGTQSVNCNNLPNTCGAWTARLQAQPIVTGLSGQIDYYKIAKVTGGTALALNQAETVAPFASCNGVDFSFISAERIGDGIVFCCATPAVMFNCMNPLLPGPNCEFARRICRWPIADMLV